MKITHNKVGQNLNLTDSSRSDKADGIKKQDVAATAEKNSAIAGAVLGESSKVEVSSKAQEARKIKEIATAAPDVDEAKVAKFRQLIDEGKYKIDAQAIADRMVDEHLKF